MDKRWGNWEGVGTVFTDMEAWCFERVNDPLASARQCVLATPEEMGEVIEIIGAKHYQLRDRTDRR